MLTYFIQLLMQMSIFAPVILPITYSRHEYAILLLPDMYTEVYTMFHCTTLFRSWHIHMIHFHVPLYPVKISPLCPVPRYPCGPC